MQSGALWPRPRSVGPESDAFVQCGWKLPAPAQSPGSSGYSDRRAVPGTPLPGFVGPGFLILSPCVCVVRLSGFYWLNGVTVI